MTKLTRTQIYVNTINVAYQQALSAGGHQRHRAVHPTVGPTARLRS